MGDGAGAKTRLTESFGTVRTRTTAAAVVVVGVALAIASVAMVILLRRSLTSDVRDAAFIRAESVAASFSTEDQETVIPVGDEEEEFVQVLDSEGRVVAASANLGGNDAVVILDPGDSRRIEEAPVEDDPYLVVAVSAPSAEGTFVVIVGRALDTVTESTEAVTRLLATGIPLLLLVVGLVARRVVGRALDPVERIRAEVDAISTKELHRRIPVSTSRDEISWLAATMNRMLERLDAGHKRQRRFVSDASHELRSPVASIRQHAEVARRHPDQTDIGELTEVILEEDARLQRLVEDLLLLSKMDEGTPPRAKPVDLDDLVLEEAERLREATSHRIDTREVSAGRVMGNEEQLSRLVRNLGENAARHARNTVALTLRQDDGEVVLQVDDDGAGIPDSERERVFERFVRLDEARDRDSGGAGLGLAIVAEIAALHDATVSLSDSPLGGARLTVRFLPAT